MGDANVPLTPFLGSVVTSGRNNQHHFALDEWVTTVWVVTWALAPGANVQAFSLRDPDMTGDTRFTLDGVQASTFPGRAFGMDW